MYSKLPKKRMEYIMKHIKTFESFIAETEPLIALLHEMKKELVKLKN